MVDWQPVLLSFKVALMSLSVVTFVGVGIAWLLRRADFVGKSALEAVFTLPMVLPPVVTGFLLLVFLGKNGPVGIFLFQHSGITVIFTPLAAIIAGAVVSFPLMYQSAKAAFQSVDGNLEDAARTLGANGTRVFFTITVPLAWPGLVSGMVLSFSRALGEFGATIMVAGNIPGKTQTLPLAIYFAAESNNLSLAGLYVIIISVITFSLIFVLNIWTGKNKKG